MPNEAKEMGGGIIMSELQTLYQLHYFSNYKNFNGSIHKKAKIIINIR